MVENLTCGIVPLEEEGPQSHHVEPVKGLTKYFYYLALQQ